MSTLGNDSNRQTVEMLREAFETEIETVINYLANSVHLDGIAAEEVKRSLASDVTDELGHAEKLAHRIKQLGGRIPGSLELTFEQEALLPPAESTNVLAVVRGVVAAEVAAISHYRTIIKHADSVDDPVTSDLLTELLADEYAHRTQFEGFLAELESSL